MDPSSWQNGADHFFWLVLISVVATHKALQSQEINLVEFGKEIYQYKDRTFKMLTKDLVNPKTRLGDGLLLSILALFLAEVSVKSAQVTRRRSAPVKGLEIYHTNLRSRCSDQPWENGGHILKVQGRSSISAVVSDPFQSRVQT